MGTETKVYVCDGSASGLGTPTEFVDVGENVLSMAVGNFNGDGYVDLGYGTISKVYISNGSTNGLATPYQLADVGEQVLSMASGSFNSEYFIDVFNLDGTFDSTTSGNFEDSGELTNPTGISVTSNYVFILDNDNHIDIFNLDGTFSSTVTTSMSLPVGLDVAGKIYVTDQNNKLVILNLGTILKIVTQNGVSVYDTI